MGFREASEIEHRGLGEISAIYRRWLGVEIVWIGGETALGKKLQFAGCDGCYQNKATGETRWIDAKVDQRLPETRNLFIETWSNKRTGRPGWLWNKFGGEIEIAYLALGTGSLLRIPRLSDLQCWAMENISKYEEVQQRAHNQRNDTWGRLVPAEDLTGLGFARWLKISPEEKARLSGE